MARPIRQNRKREDQGTAPAKALNILVDRLHGEASRELPRAMYLRTVGEALHHLFAADTVELWLREGVRHLRCRSLAGSDGDVAFTTSFGETVARAGRTASTASPRSLAEMAERLLLDGERRSDGGVRRVPRQRVVRRRDRQASAALVPLVDGPNTIGLLCLQRHGGAPFEVTEVETLEHLAPVLGTALADQQAQAALRERVKELTCLYGITQVADRPEIGLPELVQGIADLLPPAWQYPGVCRARIVLDGRHYLTADFAEGPHRQTADIVVNARCRGHVEVIYTQDAPELFEGPFLKEERDLIVAVAAQLALIVERREAGEERSRLQDQLRHADRLATIGQLAAGVAHELNEPLGNILGFAQLAAKAPELGEGVRRDLEKIVAATLHAREVVRKLMLFARQTPPMTAPVDLNQMVEHGLFFLEARCAKQAIQLRRELTPSLPAIKADPSQLQQVLVNLVVNALQAMPTGGMLTVATRRADGSVVLVVEDTGVGMTDEVKAKAFLPFFTTKDIDQGTGLGLSVVHGIVSAHGGSIAFDSEVGKGARFEVRFPVDRSAGGE